MPVIHAVRATVVTPTLTYKAHQLNIDESARTATVLDRHTWEPVAVLTECAWESPDRTQYRVVGLDPDGVIQIWRATQVCGRCVNQQIVDTPDYDIPT